MRRCSTSMEGTHKKRGQEEARGCAVPLRAAASVPVAPSFGSRRGSADEVLLPLRAVSAPARHAFPSTLERLKSERKHHATHTHTLSAMHENGLEPANEKLPRQGHSGLLLEVLLTKRHALANVKANSMQCNTCHVIGLAPTSLRDGLQDCQQ